MNRSIFDSQLAGVLPVKFNFNTHKFAYKWLKSTVSMSDEVSSNVPYGDHSAEAIVGI